MLGTDNIVNNILGDKKPKQVMQTGGLRTGLSNVQPNILMGQGFGKGQGHGFGRNKSINSNHILTEVKNLMDRLPEVKSAVGDFKVKLSNGDVIEFKLNYKDGGI